MRTTPAICAVFVLSAVFVSQLGCERDADWFRGLLKDKQAGWERQLGTLRAQQAAFHDRFARQPQPQSAPGTISAPYVRVHAILDGNRQSLSDIAVQIRELPRRLEAVIAKGGDAAEQAIEQEGARMDGHLRVVANQFTSIERELGGLGRDNQPN